MTEATSAWIEPREHGIWPLQDRVLIAPYEVPRASAGGIAMVDDTIDKEQNAQVRGVLLAAGPTAFLKWRVQPKPGANVYFAKYAGIYLVVKGKHYRLMNDDDVIAVIDPEKVNEQ